MPAGELQLLAAFHARHYSAAYLLIFGVIIAVGYAMIVWRRRRSEQAPERPYRPSQGSNAMEATRSRPVAPAQRADTPERRPVAQAPAPDPDAPRPAPGAPGAGPGAATGPNA